jgi:hypothetical protein
VKSFVFRPAAISPARRIVTTAAFAALLALAHDVPLPCLIALALSALAIHSSHLFLQVFARAYPCGWLLWFTLGVFEGGVVKPAWMVALLAAIFAPGLRPLRSADAMRQFHPLAARPLFLAGCVTTTVFVAERVFSTPFHWQWAAPGVVAGIGVFGVLRMRTWGVIVLMTLPIYYHADILLSLRLLFGGSVPTAVETGLPILGPVVVLMATIVARWTVMRSRALSS